MTLQMSPTGRERAAADHYHVHTNHCTWCEDALTPDRSCAHCRTGRRLENAWAISWRRVIDALTGEQAMR